MEWDYLGKALRGKEETGGSGGAGGVVWQEGSTRVELSFTGSRASV